MLLSFELNLFLMIQDKIYRSPEKLCKLQRIAKQMYFLKLNFTKIKEVLFLLLVYGCHNFKNLLSYQILR